MNRGGSSRTSDSNQSYWEGNIWVHKFGFWTTTGWFTQSMKKDLLVRLLMTSQFSDHTAAFIIGPFLTLVIQVLFRHFVGERLFPKVWIPVVAAALFPEPATFAVILVCLWKLFTTQRFSGFRGVNPDENSAMGETPRATHPDDGQSH